jgi:Mg2+-importing ATPase
VFAKLTPAAQGAHRAFACAPTATWSGFMGDGINDAPALHAADIGISVDSAVDIAKEAADIILLEKSLMVLDEGVVEGRRTFCQHAEVHPHDGQLQLRQRAVGAGGQRLPALPADAADAPAGAEPAVRRVADRHPFDNVDAELVRQPLQWNPGHRPLHAVLRADQLGVRPGVWLVGLLCGYAVLTQVMKTWYGRRFGWL